MEVEKVNKISDIFLWIDLYSKIDLNELVNKKSDLYPINEISNRLLSMNLFLSSDSTPNTHKDIIKELVENLYSNKEFCIDTYCINCKMDSTYNFNSGYNCFDNIFLSKFSCSRCKDQIIWFLFRFDKKNNYLYKIWQYPSKIDLIINDWKWYEKLLWEKYYKELKESMVLNSHWFSIWAFVHLRRIFEYIIFETFNENQSILWKSEDDFKKLKMEQKIDLLKDYLPKFLVSHKVIYWILSKHIHELEKEECSKNFIIIKWWIELILDERIKLLEEKKKEMELSRWISNISSSI